MLHYYYGNGKGKTSAAVGAAVRAAGQGFKVLFVQFFKNGSSGEVEPLKKLGVQYACSAEPYSLHHAPTKPEQERLAAAYQSLLQSALNQSQSFGLIVLDEAGDLPGLNLLPAKRLQALLAGAKNCEIVVTGHRPVAELCAIADYITAFNAVCHPFERGVTARRGVEF